MDLLNFYRKSIVAFKHSRKVFTIVAGLTGVLVLWACLEGPQGPPGESSTDTLYVAGDTLVILDTLIQIDTVIIAGDTIVLRDTVFIDSIGGTDDSLFRLVGTNIQNNDSGEIARLRLRWDDLYGNLFFTARFNRIFDKISTLDCIKLSPSLPSYLTDFNWPTGADLQITFGMLKHFPPELVPQFIGMEFRVIFESCLMDVEGNSLQNPSSFSFVPEPYFRLVGYRGISSYPINERLFDHDSLIVSLDSTIRYDFSLEFNSYIDSSIVPYISWPASDSLEIEGPYAGSTLDFRLPFNPDSLQTRNYTIFISPEMTDAYGHSIMHGYEIRFSVNP